MSFNFAPKGWAQCSGQFMQINQNQALFSLLGTQYGGDGRVTFALPNLQGRTPIHSGGGFTQGQAGGEEAHTISQQQMPQHIHFVNADTTTAPTSTGNVPASNKRLAGSQGTQLYAPPNNVTAFAPSELTGAGGSQQHENRQPFLTLLFAIALQGIFPSRN
jgi:microcystin-dependent protein